MSALFIDLHKFWKLLALSVKILLTQLPGSLMYVILKVPPSLGLFFTLVEEKKKNYGILLSSVGQISKTFIHLTLSHNEV